MAKTKNNDATRRLWAVDDNLVIVKDKKIEKILDINESDFMQTAMQCLKERSAYDEKSPIIIFVKAAERIVNNGLSVVNYRAKIKIGEDSLSIRDSSLFQRLEKKVRASEEYQEALEFLNNRNYQKRKNNEKKRREEYYPNYSIRRSVYSLNFYNDDFDF